MRNKPWPVLLVAVLGAAVTLTWGCGARIAEDESDTGHSDTSDLATEDPSDTDESPSTSSESATVTGDGTTSDTGTESVSSEDTDTTSPTWPAHFFAPFVDATLYPITLLGDISTQQGLHRYVLGFVVADPAASCTPSWGGYYSLETGPSSWSSELGGEEYLYDEIESVRAQGGDVMVSFGGAAGTELAADCPTVASLVSAYRSVIETLSLSRIDFDIEGAWVADAVSVDRRSTAMKQLQEVYGKSLKLWLTLPVLPSGLTTEGLEVIKSALDAGVELAGVNVMTMDYGDSAAPHPAGQMGEYGIEAVTSLQAQLATAYEERGIVKSPSDLWAMVGTTPMIGRNDVTTEIFDLTDAAQTLEFAQDRGLGLISMWSLNRDFPCPQNDDVALDCSSSPDQSEDYAFTSVFKVFEQ